MSPKTKTKPVEEDEVEDLDLEDEVDDEEEDEVPAKSGKTARERADESVTFGVRHLADHLSAKTGKTITPRELRMLIRKMAREDKPRIAREIVAGNKSRYDWPEGLQDPEVKRIIKAVTGGELEQGKKEALAKLKEKKAAERAAEADKQKASAKSGKKTKAKAAPVEEPDDEDDVEDVDFEDDDE